MCRCLDTRLWPTKCKMRSKSQRGTYIGSELNNSINFIQNGVKLELDRGMGTTNFTQRYSATKCYFEYGKKSRSKDSVRFGDFFFSMEFQSCHMTRYRLVGLLPFLLHNFNVIARNSCPWFEIGKWIIRANLGFSQRINSLAINSVKKLLNCSWRKALVMARMFRETFTRNV